MNNNLSQEELEQLMNGTLPEERSREILEGATKVEDALKETESTIESLEGSNTKVEQIAKKEENAQVQDAPSKKELRQKEKEEKLAKRQKEKEEKQALKQQQKEQKLALKQQRKEEKLAKKQKSQQPETAPKEQNSNTENAETTETKEEPSTDTSDKTETDLVEAKENEKILNRINGGAIANLIPSVTNLSMSILIKVLIALLVLVIIMASLFVVTLVKNNRLQSNIKVKASVPEYAANSANYIFISQIKEFKGENLKLVKLLVDPVATLFYFDKPLDFTTCEADLKDKNDKNYSMDFSFTNLIGTSGEDYNFIRFEPLDKGIKEFTLTLTDIYTGETVDYGIKLTSLPDPIPAKYLDTTKAIDYNDKDIKIVLENATFSSAGSAIEYKMYLNGLDSSFKAEDLVPLVALKDNIIEIQPVNQHNYLFEDNDIILSKLNFQNVTNLNSTISLNFTKLYKKQIVNKQIDTIELPAMDTEAGQMEIDLGEYKLVLEKFSPNYYMGTYHAVDKQNNFVEVKLDTELLIRDRSGMEIVINGICDSTTMGGDLVYDTEKVSDIINEFSNAQYIINLKSAGIKLPDKTIELDLSALNDTNVQANRQQVSDFIKEAFEKRLAVKSSEIEESELKNYFDTSVLLQNTADYSAVDDLAEPAKYSSQVLTVAENSKKYFAVVQDLWIGNDGLKRTNFYRIHKVAIENKNGALKIVDDEIIK